MSARDVRAGRAYVEAYTKDNTQPGLTAVQNRFKGFAGQLGVINTAGAKALGTLGSIQGVVAAIGAGFAAREVLNVIKAIDAMDDFAKSIGTTQEMLAALNVAARENGSSADTMQAALTKMTSVIGDAKLGGEGAIKTLRELNLSYLAMTRTTPEQAFLKIVERLRQVRDEQTRTRLIQQIFGKSNVELANLLNLTAESFDEYRRQALATGEALGTDQVAEIKKAGDAIDKLEGSWQGLKNTLATNLAPWVAAELESLTQLMSGLAEASETAEKKSRRKAKEEAQERFVEEKFTDAQGNEHRWFRDRTKPSMAPRFVMRNGQRFLQVGNELLPARPEGAGFGGLLNFATTTAGNLGSAATQAWQALQNPALGQAAFGFNLAQMLSASGAGQWQQTVGQGIGGAADWLFGSPSKYADEIRRERNQGRPTIGGFGASTLDGVLRGQNWEQKNNVELKKLNENVKKIKPGGGGAAPRFS